MAGTPVWSKVEVAVQSAALGTSLTVSAISKANPAVVSYAGGDTDPANGDYMLIEATGMRQINNMVVRVSAVDTTANTFQCEGLNSTNFDTLVAATCNPITYGLTMSTMLDISGSGGEAKYADDSDLHDEMDKEVPVGFTALKFTANNRFLPTDAALVALQAASRAKTPLAIRFSLANGSKIAFYSYISAPLTPTGSKGGTVQTPVAFSVMGFPSSWAT